MSILIKGMEMPICCYQCWFLFHPERHGRVFCTGVEPMMDISETLSDERASGCPLVHVPPHGRLIDADALGVDIWKARARYQMLDDTQTADKIMHGLYRAEQIVKDAPTIFEAEEALP